MRPRAINLDLLRAWLATCRGQLYAEVVRKITTGERTGHFLNLGVGSGADNLAAIFPGPRSQIQNTVGGPHDIRIVLDNQDRVSQIAQVVQDLNQAMSVTAMKSNGGLIQHIECSYQAGTQRRGQLDALRLAPG